MGHLPSHALPPIPSASIQRASQELLLDHLKLKLGIDQQYLTVFVHPSPDAQGLSHAVLVVAALQVPRASFP